MPRRDGMRPACGMRIDLAADQDAARVDGVGADDRARQLGAAGADQPGDAEDLAGMQRED